MDFDRCLISFSGGETSAYMTRQLLLKRRYREIVVVFANTSEENEATLQFVYNCDRYFNFGTVWIEGVTHHGQRKSATHQITSFHTAKRDGSVFEAVIRKYGIPNTKFKHCTRELKRRPIEDYAASIGWKKGTYVTAIGIRADEIDRVSPHAERDCLVYPLVSDFPMTKPKINTWWAAQPFRLGLKGYQGNCKWCWKKSRRKHLTLIEEQPHIYEFPARMEALYGGVGPEFAKGVAPGYRRVFFRSNASTADLFADFEANKGAFERASDDATVFDPDFDLGGGCEESCEVYAEEDEQVWPWELV